MPLPPAQIALVMHEDREYCYWMSVSFVGDLKRKRKLLLGVRELCRGDFVVRQTHKNRKTGRFSYRLQFKTEAQRDAALDVADEHADRFGVPPSG